MHRLRFAALLAFLGAIGCTGSTIDPVPTTQQTSILVRGDALIAGYGCGVGDGQVYKYSVSLLPPSDSKQPAIGTVVDCFADAKFTQLAASASGLPFTLKVHAFRASDWAKPDAESKILTAAKNADTIALDGLATWKTTCEATQQPSVTVLALCPDPLR